MNIEDEKSEVSLFAGMFQQMKYIVYNYYHIDVLNKQIQRENFNVVFHKL